MGRRVMAVLAAVVVGLIGVASVLFYANGADDRAVADQRPQTVFVAQQLVPSGTSAADAVAKGLMVPTQIAAKGVPAGALTKVGDATGKLVALTDIAPGEFVLSSRFGETPLGQRAIQVPDGQVAISVSLSDPARVGAFLTPGSRIVIYDTYAPGVAGVSAGATQTRQTRVLLDDVLVIAVGSTSLTPAANSAGLANSGGQTQAVTPGALVTVALPAATAAKLVQGIQTGALYAALSGTNPKTDLGQVVSDATLFNK
jgi:pilus assembly protein CpaB